MERLASTSLTRAERETLIGLLKKIGYKAAAASMAARGVHVRDTYKAVEVYESGRLRIVERSISEPGAGQVRIRVEA